MKKTTQALQSRTGVPSKYPQGRFRIKPCRRCNNDFQPQAPSHRYCSSECSSEAEQDNYYHRVYGINREDWLRMYETQGGNCYICESEGFLMREDHQAKLMVDHCHVTGKVRGLLCHNCNRALGLVKDSPRALNRALEYLEGATTIP